MTRLRIKNMEQTEMLLPVKAEPALAAAAAQMEKTEQKGVNFLMW